MKICFFTNRMTSGGSERVISCLANYLSQEYDVTILTMTCAKSDYELNSEVKHIPLEKKKAKNNHSLAANLIRYRSLRKYLMQSPQDVILSFVTLPSYIILSLRAIIKCPIIITVRNDPKFSHRQILDRIVVKKLYPKADAFIFQTEEQRCYYTNISGIPYTILRNPIYPRFLKPPYQGERRKEIVSVGRLINQKNHMLLIDAFSDLAGSYPEYYLSIFGEGTLKERLLQRIVDLKLENRVSLRGSVKSLENHIYASKLFVLTSDFEGMPNALLEAMVLGLPVIATDCSGGGPREVIKNGVNGILVPAGDKKALGMAIKRVLDDPMLAKSLSQNARVISEQISPEKVYHSWKLFIDQIAKT